jgi:hypothetical protein
VDLALAVLPDPERALAPGEAGIAAAARRRDGGQHAAGRRVDLLDPALGDLEQVPAVEGRSRMRRDGRTYDFVCALRAVTSTDGMTADYYPFDHEFLGRVSTRIVNAASTASSTTSPRSRRGRSSGSRGNGGDRAVEAPIFAAVPVSSIWPRLNAFLRGLV